MATQELKSLEITTPDTIEADLQPVVLQLALNPRFESDATQAERSHARLTRTR